MAQATIQFEEFDTTDLEQISQRWTKWLSRITRYFTFKNLRDGAAKINELFLFGGYDLEQIYQHVREEEDDYDQVIEKLTVHFNPVQGAHLNRFKFRNLEQADYESFDEFVSRVKTAAKACAFTNEDEEVTSQIIQRCHSESLKSKALKSNAQLTLKQMIDMGRLDESVKHQIKHMSSKQVYSTEQQPQQFHHQSRYEKQRDLNQRCRNCGYDRHHQVTGGTCPANGKTCKSCNKMNHFARMCRSTKSTHQVEKITSHESDKEETETLYDVWSGNNTVNTVTKYINQLSMPTTIITLCQSSMSFCIDTGSQVNIIDEKNFNKLKNAPKISKCFTRLYGYNSSSPIPIIGEFTTRAIHDKTYCLTTFYVTKGSAGNLLSYASAVKLGILNKINTISHNSTNQIQKWKLKYPEAFQNKVGLYKNYEVKLHINQNIQPRQEKLRHVPFHLRTRVEGEIRKMLEQDLIEPVPGPTPWISPIVPVPKRNGTEDIRICTDARSANKAINRERHITPTIDDLFVRLTGAQVISKIDLKAGYNQIMIDKSCRYITAFCTHLGIYQYKRLNFGINTASELFQKAVESLIIGINGTLNISDDIIVFGKDQAEHDQRLDLVLKSINNAGMTVNEAKCVFSVDEIDFFGLHFSANGISIQESKVSALLNAKAPKNPSELRSLLGLANYCNRFIEDLATIVQPLRQLTKSSVKWEWNKDHDKAMSKLK